MSKIATDARETLELFLVAIADAIADRLEYRQEARRRVLDMDQAVEYLGTSEDTIYRLIAEKKLTAVRFDRRTRFRYQGTG
jgi:excisionase family DNA binding protein